MAMELATARTAPGAGYCSKNPWLKNIDAEYHDGAKQRYRNMTKHKVALLRPPGTTPPVTNIRQ